MSKHSSQMWENLRLNHYRNPVLASDRTQPSAKMGFSGVNWNNLGVLSQQGHPGIAGSPTAGTREGFTCWWHWDKESPSLFPCQLQSRGHFQTCQQPSRCRESSQQGRSVFVGWKTGTGGVCGEGWGRHSFWGQFGGYEVPVPFPVGPSWHLHPFPSSPSDPQGSNIWFCLNIPCPAQCWEEDSQKTIYLFIYFTPNTCPGSLGPRCDPGLASFLAQLTPESLRGFAVHGSVPPELFCWKYFLALGLFDCLGWCQRAELVGTQGIHEYLWCRGSPPFFF